MFHFWLILPRRTWGRRVLLKRGRLLFGYTFFKYKIRVHNLKRKSGVNHTKTKKMKTGRTS